MNTTGKITVQGVSAAVSTYQVTQIEYTFEIPHAAFTQAFESLLGKMNFEALSDLPSLTPEAARTKLASFVGPLDFTLFQKIDHGAVLTIFTGRRRHAITYVFGNALIAFEMTKHDARAGLYVPLRLFVEQVDDKSVRLTYDQPSTLMVNFGSADANTVARDLDAKVQRLLEETVKRARGS